MKSTSTQSRCWRAAFLLLFALTTTALGAPTRLVNIRQGLHAGYSRLVLDCQGARPIKMAPLTADSFSVQYADLAVAADLQAAARQLPDTIKQIEHYQNAASQIVISFKTPHVRVKPFILRSGRQSGQTYRVVLDIYPRSQAENGIEKLAPAAPATEAAAMDKGPAAGTISAAVAPASPAARDPSQETAAQAGTGAGDALSGLVYTAEASVILRAVDGEDESAKFEEHRDISQTVSGDLAVEALLDERIYAQARARAVGRDDQFVGLEAGVYGKYGIDLSYDQFIKRYAFDVRTLYSGVGSGRMTLDDNLQANVQAAPTPAEVAARLNGFVSGAAIGDPQTTRDKIKMDAGLVALAPFNFQVQVTHEKREGTRPFAGAFNTAQLVELFEPIDYETVGLTLSAEYAQAPYYANLTYRYSQFENSNDTLLFDNPLSNDDTVAPSAGLIDLAPDNQYHDFSFTGAMAQLPWNSQVTANIALGTMTQDDDLVPFTINTAIAPPALPTDKVDARVNTQLYHLRLTSNPLPFMRVKGRLRYYDYDNDTDQVAFSGGYVETDETLIATAITNLPTSYTKTLAGLDLGFDVFARTSLGVGYQFQRTERENREVDRQDDQVFRASADTRAVAWLDLRASYERTNREIEDYDFDVYLRGGDDLRQLPRLRKYDQADMVRDRFQLQATVYPMEMLALGGSLIYGKDDFDDSPAGLQDDIHYIFAVDADYAVNERAAINLFYSRERYENSQKGRENRGGSDFDWTAEGEDGVTTIGAGVTMVVRPDQLDFKLSYAYSEVDGNMAFSSPSGAFVDFRAVDDTSLHVLDTQLKYYFNPRLSLAAGYLWESFDYEDLATDGFRHVPTDAAGNYQGALLSGTLPEDYDVHIIYTQLTFRWP